MAAATAFDPVPAVEGSMALPPAVAVQGISNDAADLDTLTEPVLTTIGRDLKMVARKLRVVLLPTTGAGGEAPPLGSPAAAADGGAGATPTGSEAAAAGTLRVLREWDLWGPLLLCLVLSIILSINAPSGQASLVFASVFVTVWAGAAVVTVNAKLLGGNMCVSAAERLPSYDVIVVLASLLLRCLHRNLPATCPAALPSFVYLAALFSSPSASSGTAFSRWCWRRSFATSCPTG